VDVNLYINQQQTITTTAAAATQQTRLWALIIWVKEREPTPDTYNSHTTHIITVTITVTPIHSDHFPPFTTVHSITWL